MTELIWHVDEHDNPIGPIDRDESRRTGARYRMARVMVESEDGELVLLQKRVMTKKSFPGCWDTSAGGNIDYGESYEAAATRELAEEIGVDATQLTHLGTFYAEATDQNGAQLRRFTAVYKTTQPTDIAITPQNTEVEEVVWVPVSELPELAQSGKVTDGLRRVIERYYV